MNRFVPIFFLLPLPALADQIEATAKLEAVKVYGYGAHLSRSVTFDATAGKHELTIAGFPGESDLSDLRITAPEGVRVTSTRIAHDRLPVTEKQTSPEIEAAKADLETREAELRTAEREVQLLRLRAEAAEAEAAYLRNFGKDGATQVAGPELLGALGQTINANLLAAREAALKASFAADDAERALKPQIEAVADAKQALDALVDSESAGERKVILGLEVAAAGTARLDLVNYTEGSFWAPSYELRLTRAEPATLVIERAAVLAQQTGQDWIDVAVTLSTAELVGQNRPSGIGPELRTIYEEGKYGGASSYDSAKIAPPVPAPAEAPVILHDVGGNGVDFAGANVAYTLPDPVTLRTGADMLRLELGTITLTPEVLAAATPLYDQTAYVLAVTRNTSPELLLPGWARLWFEGEMVGLTELPLLASGAEAEIGFGPIHGLTLKRVTPDRSEGRAGLIGRSYQLDEQVRIEIENLTTEAWPLRLLDRIPFSEQDDLTVAYSADPKPDVTDREGLRGVMEWRFEMPPQSRKDVLLNWQVRWPSGYVLQ